MEWYALWRLLKWIGLSMWAMGLYQVMVSSKQSKRLKALYGLTVFGFAFTWMTGWLMMKHMGYSMGDSWISTAILCSLISMLGSFLRAFANSRGKLYNGMILIGFALSIALMVVRSDDIRVLSTLASGLVLIGGLSARFLPFESEADTDVNVENAVIDGFKWMAWVEGMTVLVLFLLYIPAKKILHINLDGGTGLIGWTHGVFVIVYVLSLTFTFRRLNWSWRQYIAGGLSSFFPFGTFIFERKVLVKSEGQ
jgi:integral membrane protein